MACGKLVNLHLIHLLNACEPIVVSVSGRVQDSRFSHFVKEDILSCTSLSHPPSGIEVIVPKFSIFFSPLYENDVALILVRFGTFSEKSSPKDPTFVKT